MNESSKQCSWLKDVEQPTSPHQITTIDGFFNRKRGRPPKNRFVEVYKTAHHSPQAIFTSFKLEKNEAAPGLSTSGFFSENNDTSLSKAQSNKVLKVNDGCNRRKRVSAETNRSVCNLSGVYPRRRAMFKNLISNATSVFDEKIALNEAKVRPTELEMPSDLMFQVSGDVLEKSSVVRASGTFYPEKSTLSESMVVANKDQAFPILTSTPSTKHNQFIENPDQPEDLSMKHDVAISAKYQNVQDDLEPQMSDLKLLQFKNLLDLYQKQILYPTLLRLILPPSEREKTSEPGSAEISTSGGNGFLDIIMRQKLLLVNVATATAAAITATRSSSATNDERTLYRDHDNDSLSGKAEYIESHDRVALPLEARQKLDNDKVRSFGYLKFRFNEDCGLECCSYRNHQTHFHCKRKSCNYSFCDRSRYVQHERRHEKIDTLMADDFLEYRSGMPCGVPRCSFFTALPNRSNSKGCTMTLIPIQKKVSHFHCLKCDFVCGDSNKVLAHRRFHFKMEYVQSAGFRKVACNELCDYIDCVYALRHTHYHCLSCNSSVLSRAQFTAHKHKGQCLNGSILGKD